MQIHVIDANKDIEQKSSLMRSNNVCPLTNGSVLLFSFCVMKCEMQVKELPFLDA